MSNETCFFDSMDAFSTKRMRGRYRLTNCLYLKLNARVKKGTGSFAEPTEFLVNNVDGRLVIADWYTHGKDSYDSTVRGMNQKIHNPDIWSNPEWVKSLGKKAE